MHFIRSIFYRTHENIKTTNIFELQVRNCVYKKIIKSLIFRQELKNEYNFSLKLYLITEKSKK